MNIYLYSDQEGVAGVDWWDDRASTHPEMAERRRRARELLMGEINAAAEGAFAAGATRVLAVQGHSSSFLYELADPRLEIVTGPGPQWLPELAPGFDGAMVVGAHAMFGTPEATLAHTFSFEEARQWTLCGRPVGEFGAFAAACAANGVPVVMASGDDKFCAEAKALVSGLTTAQVKTGLALHCARHLSIRNAHDAIREAARKAVSGLGAGKPSASNGLFYRPPGPPYVFRASANCAGKPTLRPGVDIRQISATEFELRGDDLLSVIWSATSY